MVYQPAQPSETVNNNQRVRKHKRSRAAQILLDGMTLLLVAGATYAIFILTAPKTNKTVTKPVSSSQIDANQDDEEDPEWLTKTVTQWITLYPRNFRAGVVVFDLDNETLVADVGGELVFTEQEASDLGAKFGKSFQTPGQTTAKEMLEILKTTYRHEGMSDADYENLKTEMLAQTDIYSEERCQGYCRTRYGLPAGFTVATVYNENYMRSNGSFFLAYRDAAILEFSTSDGRTRNFAMALLAENFASQSEFTKLAKAVEEVIVEHFDNEQITQERD